MADDKPISYVRVMREIRDQMNREIAGMTAEEEKRWLAEQLAKETPPTAVRDRVEPRKSA